MADIKGERSISGNMLLEEGSGHFCIDGEAHYLRLTSTFFDYNPVGSGKCVFSMFYISCFILI